MWHVVSPAQSGIQNCSFPLHCLQKCRPALGRWTCHSQHLQEPNSQWGNTSKTEEALSWSVMRNSVFLFKNKSIVKMLSYCLQKPRFFMMQKSFNIFMDYTALITKNITWFFGLFTLCLRTSWHHHLFKCWFMK